MQYALVKRYDLTNVRYARWNWTCRRPFYRINTFYNLIPSFTIDISYNRCFRSISKRSRSCARVAYITLNAFMRYFIARTCTYTSDDGRQVYIAGGCSTLHKSRACDLNRVFHRRKRFFCIVYFRRLPDLFTISRTPCLFFICSDSFVKVLPVNRIIRIKILQSDFGTLLAA